MRRFGFLGILCLLAAVGYLGYAMVQQNGLHGAAQKEQQAQVAEIKECEARLTQFYQAVQNYQKDHKGGMPGRVEDLLPKYIKDGNLLFCPTAARAQKSKATISQGQVESEGKKFPVTYGFRWLTSGYARGMKKVGEAVPMIVCDAHKEAMYQAVYHRPVPADAFSDEKRGALVSEVRDSKMLAIRKNGKVEPVPADQDL